MSRHWRMPRTAARWVCLLTALVVLANGVSRVEEKAGMHADGIASVALAVIIAVPLLLIAFLHNVPPDPHECPACGYDLTGNRSGVCPECGSKREPESGVDPE